MPRLTSREARAEYSNGVADHIAIEYENKVYIVDSGKEKGVISFGVRHKIIIKSDVTRRNYIKKINKEAAENGHGRRKVFEKFGVELDRDRDSILGRERKQDSGVVEEKSQHNEGRVLEDNGNRGIKKKQPQFSLKSHKPTPAEQKVGYSAKNNSAKKQIALGMSDAERAAILKEQKITPHEVKIADGFDVDFEALEKNRWNIIRNQMIHKLQELGFLKSYKTDAIDIAFEFTTGSLRKSMNSQVADYGGNLADLAKVVMNMQPLLNNAVLLEIHEDKARGTPKENTWLLQTYVLLSAYQDGYQITPVQFEIKQYVDGQNRLYLAVALTKIEAGVIDDTILDNNQASTRLLPASAEAGVIDDTALQKGERTRLLPASVEAGVMGDTILDNNQASTRLLPASAEAGVINDTALQKGERTRLLPASAEAGVINDTILDNNQASTLLLPASAEAGVMGDTALQKGERTRLLPASNISIPRLIQKINPKDENFFKYIPMQC